VKATLARAKAEAAKEAALYRKRARPLHAAAAGGLVDDYRSDMLGPATLSALPVSRRMPTDACA